MSSPLYVRALENLRDMYKKDPNAAIELGREFTALRDDPSSDLYAPYASGESTYKEMKDTFGVRRFDESFFRDNAVLMNYTKYTAAGSVATPTRRSSPQEILAYQYNKLQKADETTRALETQWRELQRELYTKTLSNKAEIDNGSMSADEIISSIDWNKYKDLKEYGDGVKARYVPNLTRPVAFSDDSLYGVIEAARNGRKVGMTDFDYMSDVADYYTNLSKRQDQTASSSPSASQQTDASGLFVTSKDQTAVPASAGLSQTGAQQAGNGSQALRTQEAAPEKNTKDAIEFKNLQYKIFNRRVLNEEEKKRWIELYPEYNSGSGSSGSSSGSSSGGSSSLPDEAPLSEKIAEWQNKYIQAIQNEYAGNDAKIKYLTDQINGIGQNATTFNLPVEDYLTQIAGGRPGWINGIDYNIRKQTDPESITRIRPIEEVLPEYLSGSNTLSEAEKDLISTYDKTHSGLLGGKQSLFVPGKGIQTYDGQKFKLGEIAYNAVHAGKLGVVSEEDNAALLLQIGKDMDDAFGRNDTLQGFYEENPERAQAIIGFTEAAQTAQEEADKQAAYQKEQEAEEYRIKAIDTLYAQASGQSLTEEQNGILARMDSTQITEDDRSDPAYSSLEDAIYKTTYGDIQRPGDAPLINSDSVIGIEYATMATEALDYDVRIAKSIGMTLSQYYEKFPDAKKDPAEIVQYAKEAVDKKWNDSSVYSWLFGISPDELNGQGVGALSSAGKGVEKGGLQAYGGALGYAQGFITFDNEENVKAFNRSIYGGVMGRQRAGADFDKAIAGIKDPESKAYWENARNSVKDILDLPFNFADQSMLNAIYANKEAIKVIDKYMVDNATPFEYAEFISVASITENGIYMGVTAGTTALTGNPTAGLLIGFGTPVAADTRQAAIDAGYDNETAKMIGIGAAGITALLERVPFEKLYGSGMLKGASSALKAKAMAGGMQKVKQIATTIASASGTFAKKLGENMVVESSQEAVESVMQDIYLNALNVQDKDGNAILDSAGKAAAMSLIISPAFTGQAAIITRGGKIDITEAFRNAAKNVNRQIVADLRADKSATSQAVEALAAQKTISATIGGANTAIDTSTVKNATENVTAAQTDLDAANADLRLKQDAFAQESSKYFDGHAVMSDAQYESFKRNIEGAKQTYDYAKKKFTTLNETLKQAQADLNKQFKTFFAETRAKSRMEAEAEIAQSFAETEQPAAQTQEQAETTTQAQQLPQQETGLESPVNAQEADSVTAVDSVAPADSGAQQNENATAEATILQPAAQEQTDGIIPPPVDGTVTDYQQPADTGKRQFANETAQSTDFLPDYVKRELVDNPAMSDYEKQQNTQQVVEGYRRLRANGYENTVNDLLSKERFDSMDTATALVMMAEAKNVNDSETLMAIAAKYNEVGTTAGQELQARKIFLKMTPVGMITSVTQDVNNAFDAAWQPLNAGEKQRIQQQARDVKGEVLKLSGVNTSTNNRWNVELNEQQQDLISRYGLQNVSRPGINYNRASLKQRMLEAIISTPNVGKEMNNGISLIDRLEYMKAGLPTVTNADLDYIAARMADFINVGQELGGREADVSIKRAMEAGANIKRVTVNQKVKTLRMMNMLGNVTTPLRNVIGNAGQTLLNDVSHIIATGLDVAASKVTGERTVSAPTVKDRIEGMKAFIQEAENTFKDFFVDKVDTGGTNKYEATGKRTYQSPLLEAAKDITAFTLSIGDRPFFKRAFVQSLAEQMRLNGSTEVTPEMVDQSISDGKYATMTEDSRVADLIKQAKTIKFLGIGHLMEFLIPFDLVPTNIVKRVIQFSPLGLADSVVRVGLVQGWAGKQFDQKAFVNGMARGLTGTGLFVIGAALRASKALKLGTGDEEDKDVAGVRAATGDQYSPYIELFGQKIGLSFLSPAISAITMGASAYDAAKDNENHLSALWSGLSSMGDQVFDASYLTAVQDVLSGNEGILDNIANTLPGNALSQFVPSILRQVANGVDPYVRDTNDKDLLMRAIKKGIWTNIPYLRESLPAKVDAAGEFVESKGLLNSLFNPAYMTKDVNDPVLDEMLRIVDATNDSTFLPTDNLYGSRFELPGSARPLTDAEKEAYKVRKGALMMDGGRTVDKEGNEVVIPGLRTLIASDMYSKMTDAEKANAINGQVDAANDGATQEYIDITGTKAKGPVVKQPKAATSVPVYFTDNKPWYMKKLTEWYNKTGDASFLPTAINTTFSNKGIQYTVTKDKLNSLYKLYDAELSKRILDIDFTKKETEVIAQVKKVWESAQGAAQKQWLENQLK